VATAARPHRIPSLSEGAPRIVGIAPGDPWDRRTWSGASHHLFAALERRGALLGAVSALPTDALESATKLASFSPRRRRWVERYEYSSLRRALRSRLASRRAARVADGRPYATLQIGAWYAIGRSGHGPLLRASYHDANLALFSRQNTFIEDPSAAHIQREFAAERRVFDRLDVIFTLSDWLRQSFIEDFGQDPRKVVTIGFGANTKTPPSAIPHRSASPMRILFVGFDFERKGGPFLLEAFVELRKSHPDAELWIVGPKPGDPAPGVRWHGAIDRSSEAGDRLMAELHRDATVFVLTSRYEPFGNALLEAMAYGLPCIGSSVCAMPEIIEAERTGLLVAPADSAALAGALRELAADPARAQAMGAAGFRRLHERFTWDVVSGRMIEEIEARTAAIG
jgi:starch synthase